MIVFGAGVSGLSAAHELAEEGWNVSVHERLAEPGGVARSKRHPVTDDPSEYSWRGYGPWYHNVFDLMRRIPLPEGGTVYDNLSRPIEFYFPHNKDIGFESLSRRDYWRLALEVARNATASPRRIEHYASINAADYLKPRMSPKGWEQFVSAFGPWVGIDPRRASLHHIISFFVKNILPGAPAPHEHIEKDGQKWSSGSKDGWSVFKRPSNEAWFDPWVEYLTRMGVKFYFNSTLKELRHGRRSVLSATVETNEGFERVLSARHYILAVSPFAANEVATASNLACIGCSDLIQDGPHTQISFRLAFGEQVGWPGVRRAVVLTESEFNITMYRQDELWEDDARLGDGVASLWSGTACISYRDGSLFGKPMEKLTRAQFEEEVLRQLATDEGFNRMLREANGGRDFSMLPRTHIEVWDSWKFRGEAGVTNDEPKYVDSFRTRPHQPSTRTSLSNLWMAGAHTRTSTELWSMEAAAEAGRRASSMIAHNRVTEQDRGLALKLLARADSVLYVARLPSIVDCLVTVVSFCVFFYIVTRFK